MRRALVAAIRAWRWLWGHVFEAVGILLCLALVMLLLPLVPLLRAYEEIGDE